MEFSKPMTHEEFLSSLKGAALFLLEFSGEKQLVVVNLLTACALERMKQVFYAHPSALFAAHIQYDLALV